MWSLLKEFVLFLRQEKKWWLVPVLLVLGIVSIFVVIAYLYPAVAPFIYPLM